MRTLKIHGSARPADPCRRRGADLTTEFDIDALLVEIELVEGPGNGSDDTDYRLPANPFETFVAPTLTDEVDPTEAADLPLGHVLTRLVA